MDVLAPNTKAELVLGYRAYNIYMASGSQTYFSIPAVGLLALELSYVARESRDLLNGDGTGEKSGFDFHIGRKFAVNTI